MDINPYILLGIGVTFGLLYAITIILGWAITRRNRRILQEEQGISRVPTWILDNTIKDAPKMSETVSLTENLFKDADGQAINVEDYKPFIAIGESDEYPDVKNGNLVLKDTDSSIKYIFTVPDLKQYR